MMSRVPTDCDYRDYSNEVEHKPDAMGTDAVNESSKNTEQNFPVRLHYMLSELEKDCMDYIVAWQPHGRCFTVHNHSEFVERVLPLWFRQTKFASFQRQLNLYGFRRLTVGRDKGGYYHELFVRGKRFLTYRIQRVKIKGTGESKPGSPETEPNFYTMPFLPAENVTAGNSGSSHHSSSGASRGSLGGVPSSQAVVANNSFINSRGDSATDAAAITAALLNPTIAPVPQAPSADLASLQQLLSLQQAVSDAARRTFEHKQQQQQQQPGQSTTALREAWPSNATDSRLLNSYLSQLCPSSISFSLQNQLAALAQTQLGLTPSIGKELALLYHAATLPSAAHQQALQSTLPAARATSMAGPDNGLAAAKSQQQQQLLQQQQESCLPGSGSDSKSFSGQETSYFPK